MSALPVEAPDGPLRTTVHERVLDLLRNDILSGALPPGTHLRQSALAVQMQVSVSPVREALRDLAAEGFVRFDPRRGASVRLIELEEFLEVRALVEHLEPLASQLAAERITTAELAEVRALQTRLERARTREEYEPLNTALHDVVLRSTRSPRLQSVVETLDRSLHLVVAAAFDEIPHRLERAAAEHLPMIDALAARDAEALCAASLAHRRPGWDAAEDILRRRAVGS